MTAVHSESFRRTSHETKYSINKVGKYRRLAVVGYQFVKYFDIQALENIFFRVGMIVQGNYHSLESLIER